MPMPSDVPDPRPEEAVPLRIRLRPLQDGVLARPPTGQQADKAFFDELSESTPGTA